MPDSMPDLIRRAAARLQKPPAATVSIIERAHARELSGETAAPPAMAKNETIHAGPAPRQRLVTLSATSLAANGITPPGAGISRTVEEFRAVKRHVLANALRARSDSSADIGRIVLVTSAKPGDGKSFTAINLAFARAYEKDPRLLLLDADAYRQSLLEYLGISADAGWIDLVSAES